MPEWRGDPRKKFYLVVAQGNLDGTIDFPEGPSVHDTLDAAIAAASEDADECDLAFFIYECRPLKRVMRATVRVEEVEELP